MFKEFYGEFYRILDACADSAYQALFSAYEKEPGVEATVERVIRRLGVQARSDDGAAVAAAASDSGRRTDGLTLPAASTPVTSTTSSGAGAGKKTYCTGSKTLQASLVLDSRCGPSVAYCAGGHRVWS